MSNSRDSSDKHIRKMVFLSHDAIMNAHRLVEKVMHKRQKDGTGVAGSRQGKGNTKDLLDIKQNLEQAIGDIDHLLARIDREYILNERASPAAPSGPGMGGGAQVTQDQEDKDSNE
jgi:hypothetical protein